MTDPEFIHRFVRGRDPSAPVLLLLHGTGGSEEDLLPLGASLLPGAALLGVRGKVLENGMPRFFRRIAEGVFDQEDLKRRTEELAQFIESARARYGGRHYVAVGYSNGANIAASLMLRFPRLLSAAVLFRAMVPFQPEKLPDLHDMPVHLSAGRRDPIVPQATTLALAEMFTSAGAAVSLHWHPGGHELSGDDVDAASKWLAGQALAAGEITQG